MRVAKLVLGFTLLLAVLVTDMDERKRSILAAVTLCVGFFLRPVFLFFIPGVIPLTKKRLWFVGKYRRHCRTRGY